MPINSIKLRDCFKGPINKEATSKLTGSESPDEINKAKILHSDYGRAFLVYLNNPIYLGGGSGSVQIGPLIGKNDPAEGRDKRCKLEMACYLCITIGIRPFIKILLSIIILFCLCTKGKK